MPSSPYRFCLVTDELGAHARGLANALTNAGMGWFTGVREKIYNTMVDPTTVAGTWYRHIRHIEGAPTDPLWRARSRDGAARWQRDRIVPALCLADSIETMWAEWYRHLAEAALEPSDALPREVWAFEIALPGAANLSTPQRGVRAPCTSRPAPRSRCARVCNSRINTTHAPTWPPPALWIWRFARRVLMVREASISPSRNSRPRSARVAR